MTIHHIIFEKIILIGVFLNTIFMVLEYDLNLEYLHLIEVFITYFFVFEMVLKLIGLTPKYYIKNNLNCFDAIITLIALFELIFM